MEEIRKFHEKTEQFQKEMKKRRTKTISEEAFKNKVRELFTEWKTCVRPLIKPFRLICKQQLAKLDRNFASLYKEASYRVSDTRKVQQLLSETSELLFKCLLLLPQKSFAVSDAREDLVERLGIKLEHFEVASEYFEEARSCFKYGLLRASTIMAISALESCLKTDFLKIKVKEFDGKLFDLLNIYFSGSMKRLPKQYEDFSKTYVKIRNSFTHPEEFDYSENLVFAVLSTVAELMKAIEKYY
jgi:hypothetical protein